MKRTVSGVGLVAFLAWSASGQEPAKKDSVPVFHVNVVQSTIAAVNYAYRQGPTTIDFRGTILMPEAKGEATVESKRGRTEIDASFSYLLPTQRFGREYLTYTLWAITPEGGVRNLAEIIPNTSDKAKVRVSTDLQAFGLIVTAEPYSAARRPSNVVVMENHVRPDTEGKIEQVQAKYELMPRGEYTWQEPAQFASNAPKVTMARYEAILEIYEAQNALGIARSAGADRYAADTYARAEELYNDAQKLELKKSDTSLIVQQAREAVETAEDARTIAERKQEQEKLASAQAAAAKAQEERRRAEEQAQRAQAEAESARAQADAERAAREKAEAEALQARALAAPAPPPPPPAQAANTSAQSDAGSQKSQLRMTLLEQLKGVLSMRDTAHGLTATVPDSAFAGAELRPGLARHLAKIAMAVTAHPGLRITIEGNSDTEANNAIARERAESLRNALIENGVAGGSVTARGVGDTHPFGPNSTPAGREATRRVEIIISGDPIGNTPIWDHPYTLTSTR